MINGLDNLISYRVVLETQKNWSNSMPGQIRRVDWTIPEDFRGYAEEKTDNKV